jgi:hypothetical protein
MEIQEGKKDLARVLFSPHEDSQAGDVGRLEVCQSLVHCESSPQKLLKLADEKIVALQFALTDELSPDGKLFLRDLGAIPGWSTQSLAFLDLAVFHSLLGTSSQERM